jgi:hypothetical protein
LQQTRFDSEGETYEEDVLSSPLVLSVSNLPSTEYDLVAGGLHISPEEVPVNPHFEESEIRQRPEHEIIQEIFRGQQLHMLNDLVVFVLRKYVAYTHSTSLEKLDPTVGEASNFSFSLQDLEQHFPHWDEEQRLQMAEMMNSRLQDYPEVSEEVEFAGKRHKRKRRQITLQYVKDIWDWWRYSHGNTTRYKRVREDNKTDQHREREAFETRIWADQLQGREGDIEAQASETLKMWQAVLGDIVPYYLTKKQQNPKTLEGKKYRHLPFPKSIDDLPLDSIARILLDPANEVQIERDVAVRYLAHETGLYEEGEARHLYNSLLRGRLDFLVRRQLPSGEHETIVIDVKSSTGLSTARKEEDHTMMEVFATRLLARASQHAFSPYSRKPIVTSDNDNRGDMPPLLYIETDEALDISHRRDMPSEEDSKTDEALAINRVRVIHVDPGELAIRDRVVNYPDYPEHYLDFSRHEFERPFNPYEPITRLHNLTVSGVHHLSTAKNQQALRKQQNPVKTTRKGLHLEEFKQRGLFDLPAERKSFKQRVRELYQQLLEGRCELQMKLPFD